MSKAIYQKMYADKYKRDMDFVIVGDLYIGPFVDRASAEKSADNINGNDFLCYKTPTRTKIEYVKVTESIFYLKEDFEKGALYYRICGSWQEIKTLRMLGHKVECGTCYRRIETPITEREEFIEKVGNILPVFDKRTNPMWAGKLYDADCRFME